MLPLPLMVAIVLLLLLLLRVLLLLSLVRVVVGEQHARAQADRSGSGGGEHELLLVVLGLVRSGGGLPVRGVRVGRVSVEERKHDRSRGEEVELARREKGMTKTVTHP